MIGAGKYDELCTQAREAAKAQGAILIILNGEHGGGFSAQMPLEDTLKMPMTLRLIADQMEQDGLQISEAE